MRYKAVRIALPTHFRAGVPVVVPEPAKRPKSSYIRFAVEQPNECRQADFTHYRLTRPDTRPGNDVEILCWIDDHSRYALSVTANRRVTGPVVLLAFRETVTTYGTPASTLTDNGMVFATRLSGGSRRGSRGRNGLEHELHRLNIVQKNSRPNHPTTRAQSRTLPPNPETLAAIPPTTTRNHHTATNTDRRIHRRNNHRRPHRSLTHRTTPAAAYHDRPKATPGTNTSTSHDRVRKDKISKAGTVTLRVAGRLRHIGIGKTYAETYVLLLVQDLDVRVLDAATGELLRELTIDPDRDYQPTGQPPGPTRTNKTPRPTTS
ncbi:DDE-type integrase/transposase/recombinase [Symbioplanes lichenis]|uniref:DDE-type integrase/transposase/recombinase n=1 Tax=Symbioplanes lichenis TaxID=1629072 RepID=UPI002739A70F|nr:DDE-type integrase/transposase/recombinase [Actinoplanes lichenis]